MATRSPVDEDIQWPHMDEVVDFVRAQVLLRSAANTVHRYLLLIPVLAQAF
jgi:hypothetical protein